jgi:hypothetical protein
MFSLNHTNKNFPIKLTSKNIDQTVDNLRIVAPFLYFAVKNKVTVVMIVTNPAEHLSLLP